MPSTNNAAGQNKGATQQINQQTTQAMQRLMEYLGQNQAQPPPGSVTPGQLSTPGAMGQPKMNAPIATQQGSIGGISPQSAVTQPGMGGVGGGGGGQTMNPMQVQQLLAAITQHKGPGQ
jgi:hypothetical protein